MSIVPKESRLYPYDTGLKFGALIDVVIANHNREPIDASSFVSATKNLVDHSGGNEPQSSATGRNYFTLHERMVRICTMQSFCRAYSTDNIWWIIKDILGTLKKSAFLSSLPVASTKPDAYVAAGHMVLTIQDKGIYKTEANNILKTMTYDTTHESHKRLLDNLRLVVGLLSMLLDQRESACRLRQDFSPLNGKDFKLSSEQLVYEGLSSYWLFSPILPHLMFGAARFAYFITQNKIEEEIWEGFEPIDVETAIHHSDHATGKEIWDLIGARLADAGYRQAVNPFWGQPARVLELLFDYGVGVIGQGLYTNWRLGRMKKNFQGHFRDLPSWEVGSYKRVFTDTHPKFKVLQEYLEKAKHVRR